jgi:hypothetical protein
MKSCVAFAYSDKTDSIVKYLERVKGYDYLVHEDKKKQEQDSYEEMLKLSVQIKLVLENLLKLN